MQKKKKGKEDFGESSIGKVAVKLNDNEENYMRKSNSITSTKSKKEAISILFDKAFGSDIHKMNIDKDFTLSRSDSFRALRKEDIFESYPEDKGSQKGKVKSHKSGSSR